MTEGSRTLAQVIRDLFSSGKSGVNTLIGKIIDIKETKVKAEDGQEYELLSSHRQPVKGDIAVFVKTVDGLLYALTGIVVETATATREILLELVFLANLAWAIRTREGGLFGLGSKVENEKIKLLKYPVEEEEEFSLFGSASLPNRFTTFFESTSGDKIFFSTKEYSYFGTGTTASSLKMDFLSDGKITVVTPGGDVSSCDIQAIANNILPALSEPPEQIYPIVNTDLSFVFNFCIGAGRYGVYAHRYRQKEQLEYYSKLNAPVPTAKIHVVVQQSGPASLVTGTLTQWQTPVTVTFLSEEIFNVNYELNIENMDSWKAPPYYTTGYPPEAWEWMTDVFLVKQEKFMLNVQNGVFNHVSSESFQACPQEDEKRCGVISLHGIKPNYFYSDTAESGERVYTKIVKIREPFKMSYKQMYETYGVPKIYPTHTFGARVDTDAIEIYPVNMQEYESILGSRNILNSNETLIGKSFAATAVLFSYEAPTGYSSTVWLNRLRYPFPNTLLEGVGDVEHAVKNWVGGAEKDTVFSKTMVGGTRADVGVLLQAHPPSISSYYVSVSFSDANSNTSIFENDIHAKGLIGDPNRIQTVFNNTSIVGKKGLFSAIMIPENFFASVTLNYDFLVSFDAEFFAELKSRGYYACRLLSMAVNGSTAYCVVECVDSIDDDLGYATSSAQFKSVIVYGPGNATLFKARDTVRLRKFIVCAATASIPTFLGGVIRLSDVSIDNILTNIQSETVAINNGVAQFNDPNFETTMDYFWGLKPQSSELNASLPFFNQYYGPFFVHMAVFASGDDIPVLLYCDKENEDDDKYVQKAVILS